MIELCPIRKKTDLKVDFLYLVADKSFEWDTLEKTVKRWADVFNTLDLAINDCISITNR